MSKQSCTNRLGNNRCNVWSNESRRRSDTVRETHQRASVLRSDIHVIYEVARIHTSTDGDRQYQQNNSEDGLGAVKEA